MQQVLEKEGLVFHSFYYLHIFPFNDVFQVELFVFQIIDALVVLSANSLTSIYKGTQTFSNIKSLIFLILANQLLRVGNEFTSPYVFISLLLFMYFNMSVSIDFGNKF